MKWTRKELKENAKEALKRNYWKAVLVSFMLLILGGGINSPAAVGNAVTSHGSDDTELILMENEGLIGQSEAEAIRNEIETVGGHKTSSIHEIAEAVGDAATEAVDEMLSDLEKVDIALLVVWVVVALTILITSFFIIILIDVFVVNPLCIGAERFMLKSVDGTGSMSALGYTFDHNYKNGVKTTFFRDLHIFLGTLCFVIPGIYMKYQYYMVDFILAENPDMPYKEVLSCSKNMMNGQKMNAFILDISFIFWHMLSTITCGILEIFYVGPYIRLTRASLYRRLESGRPQVNGRNGIGSEIIADAE